MFAFSVRSHDDHVGMDKEVLETLLGRGLSLERIAERFSMHPSTIGYWIRKHGLTAAGASKHSPRGGLDRERLEALVAAGGSHRTIAAELGVSTATVRHWLKKFELETRRTVHLRQSKEGKAAGRLVVQRACIHHGTTDFALFSGGTYRCIRCRWEAVGRRRRRVREAILAEAGGRCALCGYDRSTAALEFHHLDPVTKLFTIGGGNTWSMQRMREEASKCVLLCSNCHAEVEAGLTSLPATVSGDQD
jgi:transposase